MCYIADRLYPHCGPQNCFHIAARAIMVILGAAFQVRSFADYVPLLKVERGYFAHGEAASVDDLSDQSRGQPAQNPSF